jgi:hypothetical protein
MSDVEAGELSKENRFPSHDQSLRNNQEKESCDFQKFRLEISNWAILFDE